MMDWDDVGALVRAGMEIGSHTVTHPILGNVADAGHLRQELADSKRELEARTGRPVAALSYPVGRGSSVTEAVVGQVVEAGYRYACVYEHGLNPRRGFDPYRLRRIKAEVGADFDRFRAKVLFPEWIRY
jgi:peptidoglycan/xylan/chitin deacetylase (PgdA/CDA1 family)